MSKAPNLKQLYAVGHRDGYLQAVADENVETKPETLEQYFSRKNTPSRNSPTGNAMVRILAKFPEMSFDDARAKANELLSTAAKSRVYRGPVVLSAAELTDQKERLARIFRKPRSVEEGPTTPIPSDSRYSVDRQHPAASGETPCPANSGARNACYAGVGSMNAPTSSAVRIVSEPPRGTVSACSPEDCVELAELFRATYPASTIAEIAEYVKPENTAAWITYRNEEVRELHASLTRGLGKDISPKQANGIKRMIGDRVNWGGNTAIGDEVKPAYKAVYGSLKKAVNAAVPEAAELNERMENLLAAENDVMQLSRQEEVGRGPGMTGGTHGRNMIGRAEATAGRWIPMLHSGAAPIAVTSGRAAIPALTQWDGE